MRSALTSRSIKNNRARYELGYQARVGLEEGLTDLRAWVAELGGADELARRTDKR